MEATVYPTHGGFFSCAMRNPTTSRTKNTSSLRPKCLGASPRDNTSQETNSQTVYNDNWFHRIAINYLSHCLQLTTGVVSQKTGYDSLVDAATLVSKKFNTHKQHELVVETLERSIPTPVLSFIRTVMPPQSTLAREYFAVFTTIFFTWLVGPCKVKESEVGGRMEKNVVHVKKCRFLEESNCVGLCTNLCKMPSQKFIKDSFGMPFTMVPNFDDMSCEMRFGQDPPAPSDDPALNQPCYKFCKAKQRHVSECSIST